MPDLLIIEDDHSLNQMLSLHFEDQGFMVTSCYACAEGLAALQQGAFDLVFLDQQLPDGLGIELLPTLIQQVPDLNVIMMTGQHDLELAIQAIKIGAADFVHKPIKTQDLQSTVDKVLARAQVTEQTVGPTSQQTETVPVRDLIGRSAAMLEVSKQIALSAANRANVLITGESGTGKEVVARLIHQHSDRSGPFVAINCAAIVDSLLESELFGHEKGAFTGADKTKPGKFELAQNGTLFLDEIGELAMPLQAKLLRALQERVIERVGGSQTINIDTRIIAATHRDLFARAEAGEFRQDLAYRLTVVGINLPPLKERIEDIALLSQALLEKQANLNGLPVPAITAEAQTMLDAYHWPGNVRELENTLTQAMISARGRPITPEHIQFLHASHAGENRGKASQTDDMYSTDNVLRTLDEVEAEHVQRVLKHTAGHKGKSCEILGISRPALDRKIAKYDLKV